MSTYQCLIRKKAFVTPNKIAIFCEDQKISYIQLDHFISKTQILLRKASLKRIAILPTKPLKTLIILFACLRETIDICLLNARYPYSENKKIAKSVQASLLQIDSLLEKNADGSETTDALIKREKALIFLPTSGSSGKAKTAVLTFENFLHSASSACKILGFSSEDTWLLSLPLFHVAGLSIVFRAFFAGGSIEIQPQEANANHFFSCNATFISLVPTQLIRILKEPEKAKKLAKQLKGLLLGGALISPNLLKQAKNFPIFVSYGLTETASHILLSKPIMLNNQMYLGFGCDHAQIKLGDNSEILVKGKSLFKGYHQSNQTIDLPLDSEGWFHTKDLGVFSKKSGFGFYARKDLMFISGGENIYPEEIEKALLLLKGVDAAFVIPIKDKEFGQRCVAFVKTEKSFPAIQKKLLNTLPKYKVPTHFYSLDLLLERSMKVDRRKLKKILKSENFCL